MLHARAGGHVLHFTGTDNAPVAHRILVLKLTAEHVSDDFHVAMRMRAEAHAGHDEIVVDDAQAAITHPFRVIIIGEAERVIRVEPAVVGVASFICFPNSRCCFHAHTLGPREESGKYHVSCLSITKRYARY